MAVNHDAKLIELERLAHVAVRTSGCITLEETMEVIYEEFNGVIAFDRIGLALIEDGGKVVCSRWSKSRSGMVRLTPGFSAPLQHSSLERIVQVNTPRIINNLADYHQAHPDSIATKLILEEGLLSSLTFPLIVSNKRIGFLFFSSKQADAYAQADVEVFETLAAGVSLTVERARLVTEMLAQQQKITHQNQELTRLNELKNLFLGMAAHDLRGAASTVKAVSELLSDGIEDFSAEDRTALLETARRQSEHMLALLDGLLDVNRIESGKVTLQFEDVDVASIVRQTTADQQRLAAGKKITLTLEEPGEGTVWADPVRLRQILDNLISNAIKYSPPGSAVTVAAQLTAGGWRFSVSDQGPGLTAEDRRHLFRDYRQLSAQPTGGEKSYGLGLAITSRLVREHGGDIGADSEPGKGATFWFRLPAGNHSSN